MKYVDRGLQQIYVSPCHKETSIYMLQMEGNIIVQLFSTRTCKGTYLPDNI